MVSMQYVYCNNRMEKTNGIFYYEEITSKDNENKVKLLKREHHFHFDIQKDQLKHSLCSMYMYLYIESKHIG